MAVNIPTTRGIISIATAYQPPRKPYLLRADFLKLFRCQNPVFLLGDLNARCRETGYTSTFNPPGRHLSTFIQDGLCQRLGPDFKTFITNRSTTTPDIILANNIGLPNYWIRKGKPTSSDHQTILMDISWNPIQIPHKPRKQYTNWQHYQNKLRHLTELTVPNNNTESIKNILLTIQEAIQQAENDCIPLTTTRTLPHPMYTNTEKNMILLLERLSDKMINRTGTLPKIGDN